MSKHDSLTCSIDGCNGAYSARGYCAIHYRLWYAHGDPLHVSLRHGSWSERFMSRVVKADDGCWVWQGALFVSGYGKFTDPETGRKAATAHRLSYVIHNGQIPAGLFVLHRCDNRPCVNPDHLFLGDCADNIHDAVSKGRHVHHATHPKAKLTVDQVRDIRDRYEYQGANNTVTLAAEYGVTQATVSSIVLHKTWRGV